MTDLCLCGEEEVSAGFCCDGDAQTEPCAPSPTPSTLRLDGGLASGTSVYDGKVFVPLLPYLTSGEAHDSDEGATLGIPISNTEFDGLYQSETWVETSPARFTFPVENGDYSVHLHFVDWPPTGTLAPGDRVFHVDLQDERVLTDFDIIDEAGKDAALVKSFEATVSAGTLTVTFTNVVRWAEVAAIEILPAGEPPLSTTTTEPACGEADGICPDECTAVEDPDCPSEESCEDGIRNQGEEGVDCGGPCPPCEEDLPADYYIAADGDDEADGRSRETPWRTIDRLNAAFPTLSPGERVAFRRGDTFQGTLRITRSGEEGSPITLSAYGSGPDPVVTGLVALTSWTDEGGGVFSAPLVADSAVDMVVVDGVQRGMGRYPDTGYLTIDSFSGTVSITDDDLPSSPNWTGAEVVIRKNDYALDRCRITSHSGRTLTYSDCGSGASVRAVGFGYFVQNDPRTLTSFGEWYHDGARLHVFFGAGEDPGRHGVEAAVLENLLYSRANFSHLTVDNISFRGSNGSALYFNRGRSCVIQSCSVELSGESGIQLVDSFSMVVRDSVIDRSSRAGVYAAGGDGAHVLRNVIRNTGLIGGVASAATQNDGVYCTYVDNCVVEYNEIYDTGYNGIFLKGHDSAARYNVISRYNLLLDDGGGIYTDGATFTGRVIEWNIILYGVGNNDGTPNPVSLTEGIYLDEQATGVVVRNNTMAHISYGGIKLHRAYGNTIEDNVCFDNGVGIFMQNSTSGTTIHGNLMTGNVFAAMTSEQLALSIVSGANDIPSFGTADYNHYLRPVDDGEIFRTSQPSTGNVYRTLAGWQSFTGQDAHSVGSPVAVTDPADLRFEYNATGRDAVVSLGRDYLDVDGTRHAGSITLPPYSSVLLLPAP